MTARVIFVPPKEAKSEAPFRRPWWRSAGMIVEHNGRLWKLHRDGDFSGDWFWWSEVFKQVPRLVSVQKNGEGR